MGMMIDGALIGGLAIGGVKVGGMAVNGQVIWQSSSLPPVGTTLNDCTWAQISKIAAAGLAPTYFAVGDCKAVHLQGTVGTVVFDDTYYVYILGFDHNGATNCIDFGTFKTALTGGVDIALMDVDYTGQSEDMDSFTMNTSNTNSGGWQGCKMRYTNLGSTDTQNGDATSTTATNPVPNTLMATLPSSLRAVMKPMTIYTDNTGGGNNEASHVTATVDYLPLLGEFEVFGACTNTNTAEKKHQSRYEYFKVGNTELKYRHSILTSASYWWYRSPQNNATNSFVMANISGGTLMNPATAVNEICPIFRI